MDEQRLARHVNTAIYVIMSVIVAPRNRCGGTTDQVLALAHTHVTIIGHVNLQVASSTMYKPARCGTTHIGRYCMFLYTEANAVTERLSTPSWLLFTENNAYHILRQSATALFRMTILGLIQFLPSGKAKRQA